MFAAAADAADAAAAARGENSCYVAYDANCDDGGFGSEYNFCAMGTDCADCGTRYGGDAGSLG